MDTTECPRSPVRATGLIQRYREELQTRHDARHPRDMGSAEVNAFLSHLAVVLSQEEVRAVLAELDGNAALVAGLLYGSGYV